MRLWPTWIGTKPLAGNIDVFIDSASHESNDETFALGTTHRPPYESRPSAETVTPTRQRACERQRRGLVNPAGDRARHDVGGDHTQLG